MVGLALAAQGGAPRKEGLAARCHAGPSQTHGVRGAADSSTAITSVDGPPVPAKEGPDEELNFFKMARRYLVCVKELALETQAKMHPQYQASV